MCDGSIYRTCSMSLSMSTLLNMVSQNSGMPLGSSSGVASSFFASSIAAFSFTSSCRQCNRELIKNLVCSFWSLIDIKIIYKTHILWHKITTRWVTVKNKQNTSIRGCDHWALKTNQSTEYLQLAPPLPLCHCATHTLHLWVPLFLSQCLVSVINTQLIILETNLGILAWNICTCTSIYSTRMKYFQLAANWNQYHLRRADTDTDTHTHIYTQQKQVQQDYSCHSSVRLRMVEFLSLALEIASTDKRTVDYSLLQFSI